jgi:hypothetical protein
MNVTGFMPPAEGKGTAHQSPMPADGKIRTYHEVSPAKLVLHLLIALFDPIAQSVQTHHFRQWSLFLG